MGCYCTLLSRTFFTDEQGSQKHIHFSLAIFCLVKYWLGEDVGQANVKVIKGDLVSIKHRQVKSFGSCTQSSKSRIQCRAIASWSGKWYLLNLLRDVGRNSTVYCQCRCLDPHAVCEKSVFCGPQGGWFHSSLHRRRMMVWAVSLPGGFAGRNTTLAGLLLCKGPLGLNCQLCVSLKALKTL